MIELTTNTRTPAIRMGAQSEVKGTIRILLVVAACARSGAHAAAGRATALRAKAGVARINYAPAPDVKGLHGKSPPRPAHPVQGAVRDDSRDPVAGAGDWRKLGDFLALQPDPAEAAAG